MSRLLLFLPLYCAVVFAKLNKIEEDNPEAGPEDSVFGINGLLWVVSLSNDDLDSVRMREGTTAELQDFLRSVQPLIQRQKLPQIYSPTTPSMETSTEKIAKKKYAKKFNPGKSYSGVKKRFTKEKNAKNLIKKEIISAEIDEVAYKNITENNENVKAEIIRSINRFMISPYNEPDVSVLESTDSTKPPIAVYFKGPYTSLIVRFNEIERHYVISPPSPFPNWFYEEHDVKQDGKENYVTIPETVKNEFYNALLKKLRTFISFPV